MLRLVPFRLLAIVLQISTAACAVAQTVGPKADDLAKSRQRAINFLKTSQAGDGSWTTGQSPTISGLAVLALIQSGVPTNDPVVEKALKHVASFAQPDGGIYAPKSGLANYETSINLMVFAAANQDGKYTSLIKNADKFLRKMQWDDSENVEKSDIKFGGAGYGRAGDRPDLSNTAFFLDALEAAGAKGDDPAVQNAVIFLSRCQNLESPHNTTPNAAKVNDGGFIYTPAAGGNSPAGTTDNGGLRSYASMTYAGLKSMIFAGLTPDDQRIKAAFEWISKHYSVEDNPGLGKQGVFYYYHLMGKTLATLDLDEVKDAKGQSHDWRKELGEHLFSIQQENGSWVNDKNDRWFEGNPDLATAFALMSLKYCDPKAAKLK